MKNNLDPNNYNGAIFFMRSSAFWASKNTELYFLGICEFQMNFYLISLWVPSSGQFSRELDDSRNSDLIKTNTDWSDLVLIIQIFENWRAKLQGLADYM